MFFKILNVLSLCNIVCFMTGSTIRAWQRQKLLGRKARNKSVTTVFLEQPLALPRSVNPKAAGGGPNGPTFEFEL